MGQRYRLEKKSRKQAHVFALVHACLRLKVDPFPYFHPPGSSIADGFHTIHTAGFKRLGVLRERVITAAHDRGINHELLYELAQLYARIPQDRSWSIARIQQRQGFAPSNKLCSAQPTSNVL